MKKTALALALMAGLSANAYAGIDFTLNYTAANTAEGYTPPNLVVGSFNNFNSALSNVTDEMKFTADSLLVFDSGTPFTTGAVFHDYIAVRIDQLFNNSSANNDVYNLASDRQITAVIVTSGQFISNQNAVINGLQQFNIYYDAGPSSFGGSGGSITLAALTDAGLTNFDDGTLVETGTLLAGSGGVTGVTVPDGAVDLNVLLTNVLQGGLFELDGQGLAFTKLVAALTNGNNTLCTDDGGTQACLTTEAGVANYFQSIGYSAAVTGATSFHTRTDGSLEKITIPEPTTVALMGLGLLGLGFSARRRNS